jgi:hypothetical protein
MKRPATTSWRPAASSYLSSQVVAQGLRVLSCATAWSQIERAGRIETLARPVVARRPDLPPAGDREQPESKIASGSSPSRVVLDYIDQIGGRAYQAVVAVGTRASESPRG